MPSSPPRRRTRPRPPVVADAKVGISLGGREYRYLLNEMGIHADALAAQSAKTPVGKARRDIDLREDTLRALLEKLG